MSRIAYVNGRYLPHASAMLHIEDRGTQFADAVYEVCELAGGMMIDRTAHMDRLERSLGELAMAWPVRRGAVERIMVEVANRNRLRDGLIYLQISRGIAPRDHPFPDNARPVVIVTARRMDPDALDAKARQGISVITVPDNRWERVDIKSTSLLPNVLARQQAVDAGAGEAWLVDGEGMITEGSSTNAWIVTADGVLVTRPASGSILRGITRSTTLRAADSLELKVEERGFTVAEAHGAREAFITSATNRVQPVVAIDGRPVANGHPGEIAMALRDAYWQEAEKTPLRRSVCRETA